MSGTDIPSTAVDGDAAATERELNMHAVESSLMMAGTQTCAACISYANQLTIANKRHDALNEAMTQMENDMTVSTELANQREQQMFTNKSEAEASLPKLQGEYKLLQIKALRFE